MSREHLIAESYHGTTTNYGYGCRCDKCRAAGAERQRVAVRRRWLDGGLPDGDVRHGTVNGWVNYRCACDLCHEAWAAYMAGWRARRKPLAADDPRHGTINGYTNYACRCDSCSAAARARKRVAS